MCSGMAPRQKVAEYPVGSLFWRPCRPTVSTGGEGLNGYAIYGGLTNIQLGFLKCGTFCSKGNKNNNLSKWGLACIKSDNTCVALAHTKNIPSNGIVSCMEMNVMVINVQKKSVEKNPCGRESRLWVGVTICKTVWLYDFITV